MNTRERLATVAFLAGLALALVGLASSWWAHRVVGESAEIVADFRAQVQTANARLDSLGLDSLAPEPEEIP